MKRNRGIQLVIQRCTRLVLCVANSSVTSTTYEYTWRHIRMHTTPVQPATTYPVPATPCASTCRTVTRLRLLPQPLASPDRRSRSSHICSKYSSSMPEVFFSSNDLFQRFVFNVISFPNTRVKPNLYISFR